MDALRDEYGEIERLRARIAELGTVPAAIRARDVALDADDRALKSARARRDALLTEIRRRSNPQPEASPIAVSVLRRGTQPAPAGEHRPPPPLSRRRDDATRDRLRRLVNRWRYSWALSDATVAEFNGVIVAPERPLGEALMVLPLSAMETALATAGSDQLAEWTAALKSYRRDVEAEVAALETRFMPVLPLWEVWNERDRTRWEELLAQLRAEAVSQTRRLQAEIVKLEERLARA